MRKILGISAISCAIFVGACASQPEDMQRAYVSPMQYESYSCTQLGAERERISSRRIDLYKQLKTTADNDAAQMGVGLILFWPTLFFLEGGDGPEATEYSRLMGEEDAVEKGMIKKDCVVELAKLKQDRVIEGRLKDLQKQLNDGVITREEFEAKRTKILQKA